MYTLYDFMKKFQYESFTILSRNGKDALTDRAINHFDIDDAIQYNDTLEEKYIAYISEFAVCKVNFEKMEIYVED